MLAYSHAVAPKARFLVGQAERLPVASCTFDLITAAGSVNYANLDLFFPEVERVLTETGVLVIYDFSAGRRFADDRWPTNVAFDASQADSLDVLTGTWQGESLSRKFPIFRFEHKPSQAERPRAFGVSHSTVKPLGLMRWLITLLTPPGVTGADSRQAIVPELPRAPRLQTVPQVSTPWALELPRSRPVSGAGLVMFGMVAATGVRILSGVDFAGNRNNLLIVAISVGLGMIPLVAAKFFQFMPPMLEPLLKSGIVLTTLSAVLLNSRNGLDWVVPGTGTGAGSANAYPKP